MKKTLLVLTLCLLAGGLSASNTGFTHSQRMLTEPSDTAVADENVDIIAYFAKGDTCDYRITETQWKVNDSDTTLTASITTKVRLVVTDSTSSGYRMTYTFTDVANDSIAGSPQNDLLSKIAERAKKNVIGTTIEFETDEMGAITKVCNLAQIKKKAKMLFKDSMREIANLPEIKALKDLGVDVGNMAKQVDVDELVEGYLEELKLMFLCHGKSFRMGETDKHEDATDEEFTSDTHITVSVDENNCNCIDLEVVSVIPQADIKELMAGIVGGMKDKSIAEQFDQTFDTQVQTDGQYTDRIAIKCFEDGWPCEVVKQKFMKIGSIEKVKQTYIGAYHFAGREN